MKFSRLQRYPICRVLWGLAFAGIFQTSTFSAEVAENGTGPEKTAEHGFTPLFNGKDLVGWTGDMSRWSVEDGAITGTTTAREPLKRPVYLFWQGGKPADFELRVAYRFVTPEGNSGVNFRSLELSHGDIRGYQADLETGPNYSGILYECEQRGIMTQRGQKLIVRENGRREVSSIADAADLQKRIKSNDWNEYIIVARGPEIILKINGVVTSHVIDHEKGKAAAAGCIALQLHPGPPMKVQFKNLRIKVEKWGDGRPAAGDGKCSSHRETST